MSLEFLAAKVTLDGTVLRISHSRRSRVPKFARETNIPLSDIERVERRSPTRFKSGLIRIQEKGISAVGEPESDRRGLVFTSAENEKADGLIDALRAANPTLGLGEVRSADGVGPRTVEGGGSAKFGDYSLASGVLKKGLLQSWPIAGAHASVDVGAPKRGITATRVVLIGAFALAAKKNKARIYVTVELPSGEVLILDGPVKDETNARRLAAAINSTPGTQ